MKGHRRKVDLPTIQNRNYEHKNRIGWMRRFVAKIDDDKDKKTRLAGRTPCVKLWPRTPRLMRQAARLGPELKLERLAVGVTQVDEGSANRGT